MPLQNAALQREDVIAVIATACNKVFTNRGKQAPNYYKQFLKEFKSDSAQLITLDMAYFGEVPQKKSGEALEYDTIEFGTPRTTDALVFSLGFKMTREAIIALQKKPYGEFSTAKMVNVQKVAAAMRASVNHTKELVAASVIQLADSITPTTKYNPVGRDGKALASATHRILKQPGTQWSNYLPGETLSQDSLGRMITAMMTLPSDEGLLRGFGRNWTLWVGPKLYNRAVEVVNTKKKADSEHNNESVLNQWGITVKVNPYWGANYTGYSLINDEHEMGYFAPVDEQFEEDDDFETKGAKVSTYFQFGCDFLNPYGIIHCPGV
jgi:hypothetical protein